MTAAPAVGRARGGWRDIAICPICHRKNECRVPRDGDALVWCVEVPSIRPSGRGWLHPNPNATDQSYGYSPAPHYAPSPPSPRKGRSRGQATPRFPRGFGEWLKESQERRGPLQRWAEKRGVTVDSLQAMGCIPSGNHLLIPEQKEPGVVCGAVKRFWKPITHKGKETRFLFLFGSERGWTLSHDWHVSRRKAVVIVEGFADTASMRDAGFAAIGRPTRAAKLEGLKDILADVPREWPIFVSLENDAPKPNVDPVAEVTRACLQLSEAIRRTVLMISPPKGGC